MLLISIPFSVLRPFWLFDIILIQLYIMADMDSTLDDSYVDYLLAVIAKLNQEADHISVAKTAGPCAGFLFNRVETN